MKDVSFPDNVPFTPCKTRTNSHVLRRGFKGPHGAEKTLVTYENHMIKATYSAVDEYVYTNRINPPFPKRIARRRVY